MLSEGWNARNSHKEFQIIYRAYCAPIGVEGKKDLEQNEALIEVKVSSRLIFITL